MEACWNGPTNLSHDPILMAAKKRLTSSGEYKGAFPPISFKGITGCAAEAKKQAGEISPAVKFHKKFAGRDCIFSRYRL